MRTTSTFSILFWVYTKRAKNNLAPLYARITVDGKKLNISLRRRIDVRFWNPQKQKLRGTGSKAKSLNQNLDEVHSALFQCYRELMAANKCITSQTIKAKYLGEDVEMHLSAIAYNLKST